MIALKESSDDDRAHVDYIANRVPRWHVDPGFMAGVAAVQQVRPSFDVQLLMSALQPANRPIVEPSGEVGTQDVKIKGRNSILISFECLEIFNYFSTPASLRPRGQRPPGFFDGLRFTAKKVVQKAIEASYSTDDFLAFRETPWLELLLQCALIRLVDFDSMTGMPDNDTSYYVLEAFQKAVYPATVNLPGLDFAPNYYTLKATRDAGE
jgi:hypothetical protein